MELVEDFIVVCIGKLGRNVEGIDYEFLGELVWLKVNEFVVYSRFDVKVLMKIKDNF